MLQLHLYQSAIDFIPQPPKAFIHFCLFLRIALRHPSLKDQRVRLWLLPSFIFQPLQLQPPLHRFQNLLLDSSFLQCLPLLHFVSLPFVLHHCYLLHLIPRLPLVTIAIEESPSLQYWDTLGNSDIHHSRSEFCCQDRVCFCDSMVCGYQQGMKESNLVCNTKTVSNHNTLRSSGKLNFVQTRQYKSHRHLKTYHLHFGTTSVC